MAVELLMPKMGMTMEEGTIIKWHKMEGDWLKKGEIVLEIQTDKVKMEIESPEEGVLLKVLAGEGDVVPVNKPIAYIGEQGEEIAIPETSESADSEVAVAEKADTSPQQTAAGSSEPGSKIKATPAAKRLAREKGIDLSNIKPGGPNGRVIAADVESIKATPLAQRIAQEKNIDLSEIKGSGVNEKVRSEDLEDKADTFVEEIKEVSVQPLKGLRKVVAERMSRSWDNAPHASINLEVDMSEMSRFREKVSPVMEKKKGLKVSYNHLLIRVLAQALKDHPELNARFIDNGIEYCDQVNIGIAVATEDGLIVPVLHGAELMDVEQIVVRADELIKKARHGELVLSELEGGSFTISNLGMYGIKSFTPIINPPEVGIIGAGAIKEQPVVENGTIVIKSITTLSLSFDHRAVDGAQAALFLSHVKELLEEPFRLI